MRQRKPILAVEKVLACRVQIFCTMVPTWRSGAQVFAHPTPRQVLVHVVSRRVAPQSTGRWQAYVYFYFWTKFTDGRQYLMRGLARILTAIAGFRVQSADRYTTWPIEYNRFVGACAKRSFGHRDDGE